MIRIKSTTTKNLTLLCLSIVLSMLIFFRSDIPAVVDNTSVETSKNISFEKEYEK